jgi:hypothetical protein
MYARTASMAGSSAGLAFMGSKSVWWSVGAFVVVMAATAAKKLIPARSR